MPLSNACPKPDRTRYQSKAERAKTEAANERMVWYDVDVRDGRCCRVCGTFCSPRAIGTLHKPHRHHLQYRSLGGATTSACLVTLCARCHDLEHTHKIRLSGDADERDELGRLAGVKLELPCESGWRTDRWV